MSKQPYTIILNKENIEKYGVYTVNDEYYIKPKIKYKFSKCKECNTAFIRVSYGNLSFCSSLCSGKYIGKNNKLDFEQIKKSFEKDGYILHTSEYIGQDQYLDFTCPNGHNHTIRSGNWMGGQRCGLCAKNAPVKIEQIEQLFKENDYKVIIPKNNKILAFSTKLDYVCPNGHKHKTTYTSFKSGRRCPYCQNQIKIQFDDIKKSFENEGYIVLTKKEEYKSQNKTKIDFICPNGHTHNISVRKWRNGRRCGKCRVSKEERELRSYLDILQLKYVMNDRTTLLNPNTNHYLELDIWIPELNKAIELNGVYWHNKEDKIYNDVIKKELCFEKGIDLLIVTDDEWNKNRVVTVMNIFKFLFEK